MVLELFLASVFWVAVYRSQELNPKIWLSHKWLELFTLLLTSIYAWLLKVTLPQTHKVLNVHVFSSHLQLLYKDF